MISFSARPSTSLAKSMRSFSTTFSASSLYMCRSSTLPAARAALTMRVTAGFCMANGLEGGGEKGWRGERAGRRWHDGVVAGRAVYHCPMNTEATPHEAGAPALATRGPDAALRLRIVLVGTQHPGNIGSAARALKTMGLARLVLVAPEKSPNAESSALAAGADDLL